MASPPWADAEFSGLIPGLRQAGEGQKAEFKEDFPEQGHTLAKEIAAFATSGGGDILLGIQNNGEVKGLSVNTEDERDKLLHRVQSIASTVKPRVKHDIRVASDDSKCILFIRVLKQDEPVFYYEHRPYIREGRASRPAEPEEVKQAIWAHGSSEHRREKERILEQQMQDVVDSQRAASEHNRAMDAAWLEAHKRLYGG